ncbi:hypothetical protein [Pyrococcus kukulkanii]|uniref:hypothetical protein n=1 Tax=Pyrococcus kukulkanii TaxID=1609559 RepID=UPI00356B5DDF
MLFRRKKKREGGLPKREDDGVFEKLGSKAEERITELVQIQDVKPIKPPKLRFVKTHHTVLKALYKIPVGNGVFKEVVTLGYVQGIAISPDGLLVISYTPRAPGWVDEALMSIARIFGKQPPAHLLWVLPQFAPLPALDYAIIVETSKIVKTAWGEFALPPMLTEEEVAAFRAIYQKARTLEELVDKIFSQVGRIVDTSLNINPFVKTYTLIERNKDERKGIEKTKRASGAEIMIKDPWEGLNL